MKRIYSASIVLSICILTLIFTQSIKYAYADDNKSSNITLLKHEVVDSDYFAAGNTVNVSGTINGDAYIGGGNVTFDGVINGDLIAGGGNVTILGKVTGDVRVAGGNIIFSSDVDKNATILGGSISLSDSGKVNGSLVSAGGNISVNSPISKGANLAGGQITLGSLIGKTVNVYTSNLALAPTAKITGDLNYWSEKEIQINPEASISGKTNYHYVQTPQFDDKKTKKIADNDKILNLLTAGTVMFNVYSLLVSLIIGLLIIKLLPVFTSDTVATLQTHPWASLGAGLLTLVLSPIIFIILLVTVIGIPVALVLLMVLIVLWFVSEIFVALFVGTKLLNYFRKEKSSKGWGLFTGLVVLGLLSLIPVINFFVGTFTYLIGVGALLIQKKNSYALLRKKNLI